jgi:hypothetical protein
MKKKKKKKNGLCERVREGVREEGPTEMSCLLAVQQEI